MFSNVTTANAIVVQEPGTLHHPGTRVAAVCHYVEVLTSEALFVELVDVFKWQKSILQNPVTSSLSSMSSVPNEHWAKLMNTVSCLSFSIWFGRAISYSHTHPLDYQGSSLVKLYVAIWYPQAMTCTTYCNGSTNWDLVISQATFTECYFFSSHQFYTCIADD